MNKIVLSLSLFLLLGTAVQAQKYFTRQGKVSFFSETPVENIEAHNGKATSVVDAESGKMEFAILIKAFQFEKALMQEHFNENYMESSTYPKATFKGQFDNWGSVDLTKDGTYPVDVSGDMTIHGVTQPVKAEGEIVVEGGKVKGHSTFNLTVANYDIEIPSVVRENIAKTVRVDVDVDYQPLDRG
ncbi:MAG: YceI family protein [Bacteroidetes bacterium]|jgi:polyisoprenoid-binding protein YceI|nr:YceI family protein [Bacteroidota bacterium]